MTYCSQPMNSKHGSVAAVALLAVALVFVAGSRSTFASESVSPDKQWEYRCVDDDWPKIVKAGTTQVVVDLSEDQSVPHPNDAEVVWAPDSKRFAFNYSPPHRPHTSYETIALYQLRGDKWEALRSPVDETSEPPQIGPPRRSTLPRGISPAPTHPLFELERDGTDPHPSSLPPRWSEGSKRNERALFLFFFPSD